MNCRSAFHAAKGTRTTRADSPPSLLSSWVSPSAPPAPPASRPVEDRPADGAEQKLFAPRWERRYSRFSTAMWLRPYPGRMERLEVEFLSRGGNNAVVRLPGRRFPGVVVPHATGRTSPPGAPQVVTSPSRRTLATWRCTSSTSPTVKATSTRRNHRGRSRRLPGGWPGSVMSTAKPATPTPVSTTVSEGPCAASGGPRPGPAPPPAKPARWGPKRSGCSWQTSLTAWPGTATGRGPAGLRPGPAGQ